MAALQRGEDRMMIDSVVWAQYINVTDTQTDSHVATANAAPTQCVGRQKIRCSPSANCASPLIGARTGFVVHLCDESHDDVTPKHQQPEIISGGREDSATQSTRRNQLGSRLSGRRPACSGPGDMFTAVRRSRLNAFRSSQAVPTSVKKFCVVKFVPRRMRAGRRTSGRHEWPLLARTTI